MRIESTIFSSSSLCVCACGYNKMLNRKLFLLFFWCTIHTYATKCVFAKMNDDITSKNGEKKILSWWRRKYSATKKASQSNCWNHLWDGMLLILHFDVYYEWQYRLTDISTQLRTKSKRRQMVVFVHPIMICLIEELVKTCEFTYGVTEYAGNLWCKINSQV